MKIRIGDFAGGEGAIKATVIQLTGAWHMAKV
jgi:hypothetical protein